MVKGGGHTLDNLLWQEMGEQGPKYLVYMLQAPFHQDSTYSMGAINIL